MTTTLIEQQRQFTTALRDPKAKRDPSIPKRRFAVYQELLFNNFLSLLSQNFPVSSSMLGQQWEVLIRQFYRDSPCHTPYFHKIGGQLIDHIEKLPPNSSWTLQYPYLLDLLRYEYLELELDFDDIDLDQAASCNDNRQSHRATGNIWIEPCSRLMISPYRLHEIRPGHTPQKSASPCCLLIFRVKQQPVRFAELSVGTAQLWICANALIEAGSLSKKKLQKKVFTEVRLTPLEYEEAIAGLVQIGVWREL